MIEHYNAFISYKHAPEDNKVAEAVHKGLERFHIPRKIRKKTGIKRINAAYRDSAVKPMHSFSENAIKVTLPVIKFGDNLQGDEKRVYECLNLTGRSSSEIATLVGYGKNKTLNILTKLEDKGYISKTGSGRGTKYLKNH